MTTPTHTAFAPLTAAQLAALEASHPAFTPPTHTTPPTSHPAPTAAQIAAFDAAHSHQVPLVGSHTAPFTGHHPG